MNNTYREQQKSREAVEGQSYTSNSLAGGYPFHFSQLEDPRGGYYGYTPTGGNFVWDMFYKTKIRSYYNSLVVGTMGSGKSTLLKSLNRMNDLVEGCKITGKVTLDGDDIYGDMDVNLLRKRVGMVFQHFNLFPHLTILENVTLAPIRHKMMTEEQAKEKAMELLNRVGVGDKADNYPAQISGIVTRSHVV